ncbi:MAG: acyloxyacyl hydrolase [Bacteroidales bacterium]|nr:MAG: acyloxyacyl hydrolase [Bacteroidales bacterium]
MFRSGIYTLTVLFFWSGFVAAQESKKEIKSPFIAGLRLHYGMIIPHSNKIAHLSNTNPRGVELDLTWHLMPRKYWEYCFCYPRSGFSVFYTDYGNPEIIGSSIAIYPYIEPFVGAHRKWSMSIRFGIGPAFSNKHYDAETNPENLFFSDHISFIAMLNLALNYRPNDRMNFRLAANYNHISNGGIKEPNLGINYPTFNIGMDYSLVPVGFDDRMKNKSITVNPDKNRFEVAWIFAGRIGINGEEQFLITGLTTGYSRLVSRVSAFSAGAEWICDGSLRQEIRTGNILDDSGDYVDHNRIALLFGHELLLGRFIFSQQLGVYLYSPYKAMDPVYQRYGLSFFVGEKFLVGINIKAHRHVADFLDLRLGFSF